MDFTGERYVPSQQGQIKYEHLHRYAMSLLFVEGKTVLDIASGEGYGAALLASKAQSVTGVDIDPQSVRHAQNNYYDPKLTFLLGSCDSVPLPDGSFDVATSFETIEHHDKHEEMLREIKRVLKPNGLLIISSPNRLTYSDEPRYVNPFHVKELYFDEFRSLLQARFKHVEIYGQRLAIGSFITPLNESSETDYHALTGDVGDLRQKVGALPSPIYFVALCSDDPTRLPHDPTSVYLDPVSDLLRQFETERTAAMNKFEEARSHYEDELRRRSNQLVIERTRFRGLQRQYESTQHQHQQLISDLAIRLEHTKAWLAEKQEQIAAHAEALESMYANRTANDARQGLGKLRRTPAQPKFEGVLDYPKTEIPVTDRIEVYGWVYCNTTAVTTVQAFLNDVYLGIVRYGIERADVADAYPGQAPLRCGYKGQLWINHLGLTGPAALRMVVTGQSGDRCVYSRSVTIAPSVSSPSPEDAPAVRPNTWEENTSPAAPRLNELAGQAALEKLKTIVAEFQSCTDRDPSILDWNSGMNLISALPNASVCAAANGNGSALPHIDHSIDFVVARHGAEGMAEARRVAAAAVIRRAADGTIDVEWLQSPETADLKPAVSIIIPVFNNANYTQNCLERLTQTLPHNFKGEIIIVDDASSDETPDLLSRWAKLDPRIQVLRNTENAGFIRSCNRGASAAQGEIIVFLNNDTLPQPGWLPPLLRILRDRPDAGAVGGQLIYPDGTLQEAGGLICSDGSGCNFGKHAKSADAPLFNFVREVDYCSGALLATRRNLFMETGGFDLRYEPAYYEDSDYCFTLRSKGHRIYYQPESVIVHFEGASCGTDLNAGVKSHQQVNRSKFVEKWRNVLKEQPQPPERLDFATMQLLSTWRPGQ